MCESIRYPSGPPWLPDDLKEHATAAQSCDAVLATRDSSATVRTNSGMTGSSGAGPASTPTTPDSISPATHARSQYLENEVTNSLSHTFMTNRKEFVIGPCARTSPPVNPGLGCGRRSCKKLMQRHPDLRMQLSNRTRQASCKPHLVLGTITQKYNRRFQRPLKRPVNTKRWRVAHAGPRPLDRRASRP